MGVPSYLLHACTALCCGVQELLDFTTGHSGDGENDSVRVQHLKVPHTVYIRNKNAITM